MLVGRPEAFGTRYALPTVPAFTVPVIAKTSDLSVTFAPVNVVTFDATLPVSVSVPPAAWSVSAIVPATAVTLPLTFIEAAERRRIGAPKNVDVTPEAPTVPVPVPVQSTYTPVPPVAQAARLEFAVEDRAMGEAEVPISVACVPEVPRDTEAAVMRPLAPCVMAAEPPVVIWTLPVVPALTVWAIATEPVLVIVTFPPAAVPTEDKVASPRLMLPVLVKATSPDTVLDAQKAELTVFAELRVMPPTAMTRRIGAFISAACVTVPADCRVREVETLPLAPRAVES
jgi:hypothetical protein